MDRKLDAFTFDAELLKKFKKLTKEKCINKSALMEKFMREWVKENSKNEEHIQIINKKRY